jgi:hypothetical protein
MKEDGCERSGFEGGIWMVGVEYSVLKKNKCGWFYQGFFLPTAGFLPLGSGKGSYRGYRGIPLNTARIQISNQNR